MAQAAIAAAGGTPTGCPGCPNSCPATAYGANPPRTHYYGDCEGSRQDCLDSRYDTDEKVEGCALSTRRCGRKLSIAPEKTYNFSGGTDNSCGEGDSFWVHLSSRQAPGVTGNVNADECARKSDELHSGNTMTHVFNPCACKADRFEVTVGAYDGHSGEVLFGHNGEIPGECSVLWSQRADRDEVNGPSASWGDAGKNGHWVLDGCGSDCGDWVFDEGTCQFYCYGDAKGAECYDKTLKPKIYFVPDLRSVVYNDGNLAATARTPNSCSVAGGTTELPSNPSGGSFAYAQYNTSWASGVYGPGSVDLVPRGGYYNNVYLGEINRAKNIAIGSGYYISGTYLNAEGQGELSGATSQKIGRAHV
jgi:hypothetical protein